MLYAILKTNDQSNSNKNFEIFQKPEVVEGYASKDQLFWQEEVIFRNVKGIGGRVLDIGIGGGRTAGHLAPTFRDYVGIDIASKMVTASNKKFSNFENTSFVTCDAKSFPFSSHAFDVVLFSFNGIDSSRHENRLEILAEIRRVIKQEGTFVFSSHSLDWLNTQFNLTSLSFISSYEFLPRIIINLVFGERIRSLKESPFLFIGDPLSIYYVRKDAQLEQLLRAGFQKVSVVTRKGILEASNPELEPLAKTSGFLYYVCKP